jgi:hypothetical protein
VVQHFIACCDSSQPSETDLLKEENARLKRELSSRGLGWVINPPEGTIVTEEQEQPTEQHECTCGARERKRADNKRAAEIQREAVSNKTLW